MKAAGRKNTRATPGPKAAEGRCSNCPEIRTKKHPYRVFVSYSHADRTLAGLLTKHLEAEGLFPITDHEIRVGEAFSEEIREMIECSHVFMPLVTADANARLWVQQEMGYAAGLHVPMCPIAIGDLPAGMAEQVQGIHIADEDKESFTPAEAMAVIADRLTYEMMDDLVRRARRRIHQGRYDCALYWTDRQESLVSLAETAYRSACRLIRKRKKRTDPTLHELDLDVWRLRQCTAFGSFSIPNAGVGSNEWDKRDPDRYRSSHERRLLRRERQAMEAYVRCFGCDLILDPRIQPETRPSAPGHTAAGKKGPPKAISADPPEFKHSDDRTAFRIELMIAFIQEYRNDDRVRVIVPAESGQITTNLIVVGDWFASEAVVPRYTGGGYVRTMFTRHTPSVLNTIGRFKQDFDDYLRSWGLDPADRKSTRAAKAKTLEVLKEWLAFLKSRKTAVTTPPPPKAPAAKRTPTKASGAKPAREKATPVKRGRKKATGANSARKKTPPAKPARKKRSRRSRS